MSVNSTDPLHQLFRDRVPEAAARQLAVVLAWLTECQLATLEGLAGKKSTPKGELKRQRQICTNAVRQCAELGILPGVLGLSGIPCSRLGEALLAAKVQSQSANGRKQG